MPTYPTYKLGDLILDAIGGDWGKDPGFQDETYELAYCIRGAEYKNWADDNGSTAVLRKIKCGNLLKRQLKEFDIIVEISGGGPEQPVGRTEVITKRVLANFKGSKVLCTNFLRLIRPNLELVDAVFLNYYLKFFYSTGEIIKYQAGSNNLRNLKFKDYLNLSIPLPPLATQHAIVTRIESLFAELDKGVEKLKNAQQQLKVYRQAVLNDCLTKGSEKWENVKLKDICLSISDGDHLPPKRTDKGIPFITISDIKCNSIDFSNVSYMTEEYYENLSQNRKAMIGDILYTVTGSFGIPVLVEKNIKFCFQRHIGLIRPNVTIVMQRWLYYMMQSPIIYSQATEKSTGTAQKTVTLSVLRDFELCLPTLPEQQRIVQEIETRLSACDEVEKQIAESLQQAEALRQSILKKAFSGELV